MNVRGLALLGALSFFTFAAPSAAHGHARSHACRLTLGDRRYYWPREYRRHRMPRRHRSLEAKREFWAMSGYPHGRPGFIVDHIVPLACGGADAPSNMQWQTIAAAKTKDKTERTGCARH